MNCTRCNKRLSLKTTRVIDGKTICSACLFPKLRKGIPASESIIRCETCGKPTNGRGYYGPQCQCNIATGSALRSAHRIG